jgi:hypothetical protein
MNRPRRALPGAGIGAAGHAVFAPSTSGVPPIGWIAVADAAGRLADFRDGRRDLGVVGARELRVESRLAQRDAQWEGSRREAAATAPRADGGADHGGTAGPPGRRRPRASRLLQRRSGGGRAGHGQHGCEEGRMR